MDQDNINKLTSKLNKPLVSQRLLPLFLHCIYYVALRKTNKNNTKLLRKSPRLSQCKGKKNKLRQKNCKNKGSTSEISPPVLVSLERYSWHRIYLQNPHFTLLELLVAVFSKWEFSPEKSALYELWECDQKFYLVTAALSVILLFSSDLQGWGKLVRQSWSSVRAYPAVRY